MKESILGSLVERMKAKDWWFNLSGAETDFQAMLKTKISP